MRGITPLIVLTALLFFSSAHAQSNFIDVFAGNGSAAFSGDNLSPSSAALSSPSGLWKDSNGDIFVADSANHRVRKITASTNRILTVAGSSSVGGYGGDGDAATSALLNNPQGVWVSAEGVLYIADTDNCRVRSVSPSSNSINTFAGTASCGSSINNTSATATMLSFPQAMTGDSSGVIYISDTNNHVILKVQSGIITVFAGKISSAGSFSGDGSLASSAALNAPQGLWLTTEGLLLVADSGNHRIRSISLTGSNTIRTMMGDGVASWRGDGGFASSASLNSPRGVCVGEDGPMYVTDAGNHRIRVVDGSTRIVSTFAGGSGPSINAQTNVPRGIALDPGGNLYFADHNSGRVRMHDFKTNTLSEIVDQLHLPEGLFLDTLGDLYIADAGHGRLQKVNMKTKTITTILSGNPGSVYVDTAGVIYTAEGSSIRRKMPDGTLTVIAGTGAAEPSPDGTLASVASFGYIHTLIGDSTGAIYFTDYFYHKIRTIDHIDNKMRTIAGNGATEYSPLHENTSATSASLSSPTGLWFDSLGNCFIADYNNHRIRKVTTGSRLITTVAGNGKVAHAGDGGHPLQASFLSPYHLIGDSAGTLYVTDCWNNRVRKIDLTNNIISTIIGNGIAGAGGIATEGTFGTSSFLNNPYNVVLDVKGTLYFTDKGNHKIRKIFNSTRQPSTQPTTIATHTPTIVMSQPTPAPSSQPLHTPTMQPTPSSHSIAPLNPINAMFIEALAGNGSAAFSGDNLSPSSAALSSPSGLWKDSNGDIFVADSANHRVRKITASTSRPKP